MDHNVEVLLRNMTGYDESNQYGLEQNVSQHDNTLWNMISVNESDWDGK